MHASSASVTYKACLECLICESAIYSGYLSRVLAPEKGKRGRKEKEGEGDEWKEGRGDVEEKVKGVIIKKCKKGG